MSKRLYLVIVILIISIILAGFYFDREVMPIFILVGLIIGIPVGVLATRNTEGYMEEKIISGIVILAIVGICYLIFLCLKLDKYYFDFASLKIKTESEVNKESFDRIFKNIESQTKE